MGITIPNEKLRSIILNSYKGHRVTPGELLYIDRHLQRFARTLRLLPANPGKLLDIGVFPGHTAILAAAKGWAVTGISKIDGTFVTGTFTARMQACGIPVLNTDMERDVLPLEDDSFDCVFFNEIAEHLAFNPFHALDQTWRVLKPGGRLVFSVPNLAAFDHIWALLRGRSFYPVISQPLSETFHADIGQRHIREYTPGECKYLLAHQDKYLYRYNIDKTLMDRSWDGLFYTQTGYRPGLARIRPGTVLRSLVTRICERYRSNIIILAHKPLSALRISGPGIEADGFYPSETSGADPAFVRQPLPECRWMREEASLACRLPRGTESVREADILAWMPAPAIAGPLTLQARVNDVPCRPLSITPGAEPLRRALIPAHPVTLKDARPLLTIRLLSNTWSPQTAGMTGDTRRLGPMLYTGQILLRT